MYVLTKKAIADLRIGELSMVQVAIGAIDKSTEAILKNFSTLTVEEGFSVIKVIDEFLSVKGPIYDAAVDSTHIKLLDSLKSLKSATKTRIEIVYSKLSISDAKEYVTETYTNACTTAYSIAKSNAPVATETVEGLAQKAVVASLSARNYVTGKFVKICL